jgi:DNA-binding MarR family transcriptional regulator
MGAMEDELLAIQQLYPQVFHACHVRHARSRRTNRFRVSERDQALLAHLSLRHGRKASDLARHFGVGLPTLSEAVKRLERAGYAERERSGADRRAVQIKLTARGTEALRGTSVLDDGRLARVLAHLTPKERRTAVAGLALLARACGALQSAENAR